MNIRPANTRGYLNAGWIESRRTFSNNSYWDPKYQGWGNLKVINDDRQQPGNCVPNHEHRNYDILGYMVEGELEHTDSLGNINRAVPGQVQHMWCGSSIWHTEASVGTVPARYLQLWITPKPELKNTPPYYEIIEKDPNTYGPIAVELQQAMTINAGWLTGNNTINISNQAYIYIVQGTVTGENFTLTEGDGAELSADLTADFNAHIIIFYDNSISKYN
jgi:redox-sensitive bicupin YhaK (pirin superfamily)